MIRRLNGMTKVGTPVPSREREAAAQQSGEVVVYKMSTEEIQQYLEERYGDRLDKPGKREERPQTPTEETGETAQVAPDQEAKPGRMRKPRPEVTREAYLALRLQGKGRIQALRELFAYVGDGYRALDRWGLKDLQVEQAELARLKGEPIVSVTVPETAATAETLPTITVPVPVGADLMRAVLQAIITDVHATARSKGWHEAIVPLPVHLALIHSEVSEALQADRKGEGDAAVAEELADVVIRVMDTAAAHGLDLAGALLMKMDTNKARPYRHGGRKY